MYRDSNSRPNVSEGYGVTSELPGRLAYIPIMGVGEERRRLNGPSTVPVTGSRE